MYCGTQGTQGGFQGHRVLRAFRARRGGGREGWLFDNRVLQDTQGT